MSRYKTFDATGIAPGGRLFAGDLNAIQDRMADQSNFGQTIDLAALRIGDTAIQLLKYGAGEARLTAALRTDGILRGLGGIYFGAFTTTQRDAIPAGSRPFGLHIFNTTTGQLEYNAGTDAAPSWLSTSPVAAQWPVGGVMDWPWASGSIPASCLLPYGQAVSRTTYAALHALASAAGYPWGAGDGSTTFNLPDYRGRVGVGKDNMGGVAAGRVTVGGSGIDGSSLGAVGGSETVVLVTGNIPAHNHAITGAPGRTGAATLTGAPTLSGSPSNGTLAVGVGSLVLPNHGHSISDPTHAHGVNDPGHAHTFPAGFNVNAANGSYAISKDDFQQNDLTNGSGTGITIQGAGTGISVGGITSTPGIGGSPALSGSIGIGTLAVGAGSLAVSDTIAITAGTLGTANTGGGAAHSNMAPVLIVNKMIRAL